MNRGQTGIVPRTTRLSDESYLDFVETFRMNVGYGGFPVLAAAGDALVEKELGSTGPELNLKDIKRVFNKTSIAPTWQRMMRSHQEMMWRRVRNSFLPFLDEMVAEMDAAEKEGPGKLVYDADFHVPDYARREIHLQPGGYTEDPIGGVVFHYGTKVFYAGMNDHEEVQNEVAQTMTLPEDGKVERVLDLGCSIGQATIKMRDRFPDAEIWGLDVALPMLRYGHKVANDLDVDVNFIQALAEDMPFEDGHFDAVMAYILFHEVPSNKFEQIIAEVFRVLRPGGTFSIFEFPSASQNLPPSQRFMIDYDSRNNCEPYSPGFVYADFHKIIKDAGFELEQGPPNSNAFLQTLVATKPA